MIIDISGCEGEMNRKHRYLKYWIGIATEYNHMDDDEGFDGRNTGAGNDENGYGHTDGSYGTSMVSTNTVVGSFNISGPAMAVPNYGVGTSVQGVSAFGLNGPNYSAPSYGTAASTTQSMCAFRHCRNHLGITISICRSLCLFLSTLGGVGVASAANDFDPKVIEYALSGDMNLQEISSAVQSQGEKMLSAQGVESLEQSVFFSEKRIDFLDQQKKIKVILLKFQNKSYDLTLCFDENSKIMRITCSHVNAIGNL